MLLFKLLHCFFDDFIFLNGFFIFFGTLSFVFCPRRGASAWLVDNNNNATITQAKPVEL